MMKIMIMMKNQDRATPENLTTRTMNLRRPVARFALLSLALGFICGCAQMPREANPLFKFSFRSPPVPGCIPVTPETTYSNQTGFGFEPGADVKFVHGPGDKPGHAITSDKSFAFSVALPEGNYKVLVTLGNPQSAAETTVEAELRRLMLQQIRTQPGQFQTCSFIVNVRQPAIAGGGQVRLKDREKDKEKWAWDDRLTLEFLGDHPSISALEIQRADVPTLFILGDSTVCDQSGEPFNSWGQMLPRFFKPAVAVANHAESGESVASSLSAGRFQKVWSLMKRGDWLFVQFGHNDMKSRAANALQTYTGDLRKVVDQTRARGGFPVLCTPVSRRSFDAGGKITNSFGGYPDAVRLVAREKNVPLIDLQEMGAAFYQALGPEAAPRAFASPREITHHSDYGSYEIAQCVLQGIRQNNLPIARFIVDDFKGFDPAHPDPMDSFKLPPSPLSTRETPEGN
jgi:lysophospholipase L1-like esterase